MLRRTINPTAWLQHFNLNQGIEVAGATRTLYLSGQTSSDADGAVLHPGDLVAQFEAAWANVLEAVAAAGMTAGNIVRLNIYTTDVEAFMAAADRLVAHFAPDEIQMSCTLLGVARLYDPAALVELEATACA
jgi:enamine deaminase RidA (YjgF/YER057c/UK114 family)